MKTLLVLTHSFPYGTGEEFLAAELRRVSGFDRVLVVPCSRNADAVPTKQLPKGVECLPLSRVPLGRGAYFRILFRPRVQAELFRLLRQGRLRADRAHELLYFEKSAEEIFAALRRAVAFSAGDSVVLYSYWLYDAAAAGAMLAGYLRRKGVRVLQISRAHRFDIYAERSAAGYLPMRAYLFRKADRIFPCSEDGAQVLRREAGREAGKIRCAYLGTRDLGAGLPSLRPFHIVSCSYLVPVKRLHLLIGALKKADFPVVWTHIGSGPLEDKLRALAAELPPGVKAEFLGAMDNGSVLEYYRTHRVSAFLNVSSSEGIPVTVMEACSFGIPVVATDVGGTKEIVSSGENGFLIPRDFSPDELLGVLRGLAGMEETRYGALSANARRIWGEKFSAEKNYRKFYEELSERSET